MTLTLSIPFLLLAGFSLALFIGATILCHSQGMFEGRGGLGGAIEGFFIIIIYGATWAIPSLLAWAAWATWWRT